MQISPVVIAKQLLCATLVFAPTSSAYADSTDVRTAITVMNAAGFTDTTWTTDILENQAKRIADLTLSNTKQTFLDHGGKISDWNPTFEYNSRFRIIKNKKYGVVQFRIHLNYKIKSSNQVLDVNALQIMGLRGSDMIALTCGTESAKPISLVEGPCDAEIRRTFGITLGM